MCYKMGQKNLYSSISPNFHFFYKKNIKIIFFSTAEKKSKFYFFKPFFCTIFLYRIIIIILLQYKYNNSLFLIYNKNTECNFSCNFFFQFFYFSHLLRIILKKKQKFIKKYKFL